MTLNPVLQVQRENAILLTTDIVCAVATKYRSVHGHDGGAMRNSTITISRTASSSSVRMLQRAGSGVSSYSTQQVPVSAPSHKSQRRSNAQRRISKNEKASGTIRSFMFLIATIFCCAMLWSIVGKMKHTSDEAIPTTGATVQNEKNLPRILEKEPILQLLRDAGITELDQRTLDSLPTWDEVTTLYGEKPVLHGMETCNAFQEASDAAEHFLAVAGTFNSGTNLLAELLIHNCQMPARMAKYGKIHEGIRWQVPWGKHTPVDDEQIRQGHKTATGAEIPADNVFPAVTVRDPAVWAASMCRHEYAMEWTHAKSNADANHCPNFVPNDIDMALDVTLRNASSVPVLVKYAEFDREHGSMIEHWNDYYKSYLKQDRFPRLMVRFEDLVFHPKPVVEAVCKCAGGEMKYDHDGKTFQYIVQSAKITDGHGSDKTGYIDAIVRYGSNKNRWKGGGMTDEDRRFATTHLDQELMGLFGYKYPDGTNTKSVVAT